MNTELFNKVKNFKVEEINTIDDYKDEFRCWAFYSHECFIRVETDPTLYSDSVGCITVEIPDEDFCPDFEKQTTIGEALTMHKEAKIYVEDYCNVKAYDIKKLIGAVECKELFKD